MLRRVRGSEYGWSPRCRACCRRAAATAAATAAAARPGRAGRPTLAASAEAAGTEFQIEIVEGKCQPHPAGQTLKYPEEKGKICPWLMDAMNGVIRVLEHGGTLPWMYAGTPYQKVVDPNGLTTEFIRCPDPTRVVVAKISRRRV